MYLATSDISSGGISWWMPLLGLGIFLYIRGEKKTRAWNKRARKSQRWSAKKAASELEEYREAVRERAADRRR